MPLFLITSLYDEGISPNTFRVVEAASKQAIAQHMLEHPERWDYFLYRCFHEEQWSQPSPQNNCWSASSRRMWMAIRWRN